MKVDTDIENPLLPDHSVATTRIRGAWWRRLRGEQLVAASVAIALNVAAAWLLARHENAQLPVQVGNDHVIELIFLKREPKPVATRPTVDDLPQPTATTAVRSQPRATAQASQPAAVEPLQAADSAIAGSTTRHRLDLSVREAAVPFERGPLAGKQTALISEARIHLPLVFTDRSLGGRMRSHGMKMLCQELRAALGTSPGSAASILASMKEQGCKI